MPDRRSPSQTTPDHDLLIEIGTKLDRALSDIAALTDSTGKRVENIEGTKLDRAEFEKWKSEEYSPTKSDVRQLRAYSYMAIGVIGFLNFLSLVLGIYSYTHFK